MISLYTSAFNLESNLFDWEDSLNNFANFADEVIIGTTAFSNDNSVRILERYCSRKSNVKLVVTDFSLDNPEFDGKIKNAALHATSHSAKILLDLDEFIPLSHKQLWIDTFNLLHDYKADGVLIPSINLCKDIYHYKDIGYKFYLHKGGLSRGVWKEAYNQDGSININRSDTTELIHGDGSLAKCLSMPNSINLLRLGGVPYVFHKWAVDVDKRIAQNRYWSPVWENRAKKTVNNIILDKKELENIQVYEHGLPLE